MSESRYSISPEDLATRLETNESPLVLDVRTGWEYHRGHVPGAVHRPFWRMPGLLALGCPLDTEVVVSCGHGPRAWMATAVLRAAGHGNVRLLRGHMARWHRLGFPVER
jgi:hydroxyacylglutathione hydrolase